MATVQMTGPAAGAIQINGKDYIPVFGIYAIPQELVPKAQASGLELIKTVSRSGAPTTTDIPAGQFKVWKNTSDGTVRVYYNDAGTLKSTPLTNPPQVMRATSPSLGGSALTTGQRITTTVTVTGAAAGMPVAVSPTTHPGDGYVWSAHVSATNTVTVSLLCITAGTPTASTYGVAVFT